MSPRTRRSRRLLALATGPLVALAGAVGTALPAQAAVSPVTVTFDYTGSAQPFVVPDGVSSIAVTVAGGHGGPSPYDPNPGGRGAAVSATLAVTGGSVLSVVVASDAGGTGATCFGNTSTCGGYGAGTGGTSAYGGGGGGSSAVRAGGSDLLLAAGGGGAGAGEPCGPFRATAGNGGDAGASGSMGGPCTGGGTNLSGGQGGAPGSATAGGAGGAGGAGTSTCPDAISGRAGRSATGPDGANANANPSTNGGGGGAGLFGGGGGGNYASTRCPSGPYLSGNGGGGGGSSYVTAEATAATVGLSGRDYGTNGQVTITYTPVVSAITLSPSSSSIPAGGSQTYTVTATTANGSADVTDESTLTIAPSSGGSATGASCTANQCSAQTAGTYTVTATRGSLTSSATLTVTSGAPAVVTATSGSGQSATAGQAFANPLVASVTDAYGNPVPGATVTFAVDPSSTGTATVSNGGQATTGSTGQASVTLTAGSTAGPVTVTATSGTSSAAFLETVTAAGPARADLTVTLGGPTSIRNGGSGTLTVTVQNNGPSASGRYAAAIVLPRQLTPTNLGSGTRYGSVVVFRGTSLASGASTTYSVSVTARGKGNASYAGAALATTADPKLGNNLAARTLTIN